MHWQLRPNQSLSKLFIIWKENLTFRVSIKWFQLWRHNTFTPFWSNYKSKSSLEMFKMKYQLKQIIITWVEMLQLIKSALWQKWIWSLNLQVQLLCKIVIFFVIKCEPIRVLRSMRLYSKKRMWLNKIYIYV